MQGWRSGQEPLERSLGCHVMVVITFMEDSPGFHVTDNKSTLVRVLFGTEVDS